MQENELASRAKNWDRLTGADVLEFPRLTTVTLAVYPAACHSLVNLGNSGIYSPVRRSQIPARWITAGAAAAAAILELAIFKNGRGDVNAAGYIYTYRDIFRSEKVKMFRWAERIVFIRFSLLFYILGFKDKKEKCFCRVKRQKRKSKSTTDAIAYTLLTLLLKL